MSKFRIKISLTSGANLEKCMIKYKLELQDKCKLFAERLAEIGQNIASNIFDKEVTVITEPIEKGYKLIASGEDVFFVEFGTGVFAGSDHPWTSKTTEVKIYPGSWAETHKQTWQKWIGSGKDPMGYPYNQEPQKPMLTAYETMLAEINKIAKEVFG